MFVGIILNEAADQLRDPGIVSHEDRIIADIKRQLQVTFNAIKKD